jgi:uncharacterized protein
MDRTAAGQSVAEVAYSADHEPTGAVMPLSFLSPLATPAVIGMLHVPALPGTPRHASPLPQIQAQVAAEAEALAAAGVHALLLENMHDAPYLRGRVGPEIVAAMTAVAVAVTTAVDVPVGVQVLAGANREALAVALAADLSFVRVEGFVFGHVADEGWLDADAGILLRYRRQIGAEGIQILADVKKKHAAHTVTADVTLAETARAAAFCGADAVIVTGGATGDPAAPTDLAAVKQACALPVIVGSGVTAANVAHYAAADALIVGSSLKQGGHWQGAVDPARVAALLAAVAALPR